MKTNNQTTPQTEMAKMTMRLYNMTPAQREMANALADAVGYVMTEPTNYRLIIELNTYPDSERNDRNPIPHYYMIDGAHEELAPGHTEEEPWSCEKFEYRENTAGLWIVDNIHAADHHGKGADKIPTHAVHMPAVIKWAQQMIRRNRVTNIYADCY